MDLGRQVARGSPYLRSSGSRLRRLHVADMLLELTGVEEASRRVQHHLGSASVPLQQAERCSWTVLRAGKVTVWKEGFHWDRLRVTMKSPSSPLPEKLGSPCPHLVSTRSRGSEHKKNGWPYTRFRELEEFGNTIICGVQKKKGEGEPPGPTNTMIQTATAEGPLHCPEAGLGHL